MKIRADSIYVDPIRILSITMKEKAGNTRQQSPAQSIEQPAPASVNDQLQHGEDDHRSDPEIPF